MEPNRISSSRPQDLVKTKLSDLIVAAGEVANGRPFHLGQVIDSTDPKNANRLRIRIPILDDPFYFDKNGNIQESIGDSELPYCLPAQGRNLDTPENGSVVLVGLMDPLKPYNGRVWFSAVSAQVAKDLFDVDRLQEEVTNTEAWKAAEDALQVQFNNTPGLRGRATVKSKKKETNYKTGIRGKDKNKVLLEKGKTTIIQNEGAKEESKVELTENFAAKAKELSLLSSQSSSEFHPVFDTPLYQFMQSQMDLIQSILNILNSPGITTTTGAPVTPNPSVSSLIASYNKLKTDFAKLKEAGQGASKFIKIN